LKTDNGWQLIGVQSSAPPGQHPLGAAKPALSRPRFTHPAGPHAPHKVTKATLKNIKTPNNKKHSIKKKNHPTTTYK
ncbi:hypothetical protein ACVGWM_02715, partial [Enterobacter hormaechei]